MALQEVDVDLHERFAFLDLLAVFYEDFKAFSVQIYSVDADVEKQGYSAVRLEADGMLCVEHEDYLAVFRCADDGIFWGYGCAVAHHFACEAFIRHVLQSGSQSGDGAGNDGGGNDTFFCGRCCFLCSFCGECCVCTLRRGFLFEGIRRSLQISLQLCLDNRYLGSVDDLDALAFDDDAAGSGGFNQGLIYFR